VSDPVRRKRGLVVVLTALLALAGGLQATPAAAVPPPTPAGLPTGIEALQPYVGQKYCDPVAKPGVRAFSNLLLTTYKDTSSLGIVRDCGVGGQSEHKEGRAWDWGVTYSNATDRAHVNEVFHWLFATDARGNQAAMARRLGLMYIIWNNQIWKAYQLDRGWQAYNGSDPHTGHVHFSFGWAGARQATSYWTNKVAPIDYGPSGPPVNAPIDPKESPDNIPVITKYGSTTLQVGSTGEAVKVVQTALRITADGSYGAGTKTAVSAFQDAQQMKVTGTFGPLEWKALFPVPTSPFGALELANPALGPTMLTGWAIDADKDGPVNVHFYADKKLVDHVWTNVDRPDLTAKYSAYPATHGFRFPLTLGEGTHEVCAYGINATGTPGSNTQLGCLTANVTHNPVGEFTDLLQSPDGVTASGWALDPDTVNPVRMYATLDGTNLNLTNLADQSRPILSKTYTEYGDLHGFSFTFPATDGDHRLCVSAYNVPETPGADAGLACRWITVRHDPAGQADPLGSVPGKVVVSGRVIDPDVAAPIKTHVYVDSALKLALTADIARPALTGFEAYGTAHGYRTELDLPQGDHQVCVYGINATGTPGSNMSLGCQSVSVNHVPVGKLELLQQQPGGTVAMKGWTADPDAASALTVQVTVDGRRIADLPADDARPDVAELAGLGVGNAHGYARALNLDDGTHEVCVTAINATGTAGTNAAPSCLKALVRHMPIGPAPKFKRVPAGLVVYGWALDLDTSQPVAARVMVDGARPAEVPADLTANIARTDVAAAYPGYGQLHGWATPALNLKAGVHTVCATGINAAGSPGADAPLGGCAKVTISHSPVGSKPSVAVRSTGVAFSGWAIDQDTTKPVTVLVTLDGRGIARIPADLSRLDLRSRFPDYGTAHGWSKIMKVAKGSHTVCVRGDNVAGTVGGSTNLGCTAFRV
jgi:peptidoglycan hydrolase-like protein with peptidoglycan-binding domain